MTVRAVRFGLERDVAFLFWAVFFLQTGLGATDRYKPLFIESLGTGPALVGALIGLAELARLIALVGAGPLSDRLPTRLLIGGARMLPVLAAAIFVAAQQWWHLLPSFLLTALANVAWPSVSQVIETSGSQSQRARRFFLVYTIAPGFALLGAPLLGGLAAERFGLRAAFVVLTAAQAVAAIFFLLVRPRARPKPVGPAASYRAILRHRPTMILCLLEALIMFAAWVGLTLAPNYLRDVHQMSLGGIGALGSLVAIGSIATALALTRFSRLGHSLNGLVATAVFLPGVFVLLLAARSVWVAAAAFLCWGIAGVVQQTFYAAVGETAPEGLRTRAFALVEVAYSAGIMLGGFVAGVLYGLAPTLPLWIALVLSVAAVLAALALRWSNRDALPAVRERSAR